MADFITKAKKRFAEGLQKQVKKQRLRETRAGRTLKHAFHGGIEGTLAGGAIGTIGVAIKAGHHAYKAGASGKEILKAANKGAKSGLRKGALAGAAIGAGAGAIHGHGEHVGFGKGVTRGFEHGAKAAGIQMAKPVKVKK